MAIKTTLGPFFRDSFIPGQTGYFKANLFGYRVFFFRFAIERSFVASDGSTILISDPASQSPGFLKSAGQLGDFYLGAIVDVLEFKTSLEEKLLGAGTYYVSEVEGSNRVELRQYSGNPALPDGGALVSLPLGDPGFVDGVNISTGTASEGAIRILDEPKAALWSYGLIGNNEGVNYRSKVDDQELNFELNQGAAIPTSLTFMSPAFKKSAQFSSPYIRKIAAESDPSIGRYVYEISQVVTGEPYYKPDYYGIIKAGDEVPSLWRGDRSLGFVGRVRLFPGSLGDFNYDEHTIDTRPGSMGWIRESYNQGAPVYPIVQGSTTYNNTINALSKDTPTEVTFQIEEGSTPPDRVYCYFVLDPEEDANFKNNNDTPFNNLAYDAVAIVVGGGAVNGEGFGGGYQAFVNCSATSSGGITTVILNVDFGADTKAKIAARSEKNYWMVYNAFRNVGVDLSGAASLGGSPGETTDQIDFNQVKFEVPSGTLSVTSSVLPHKSTSLTGAGFQSGHRMCNNESGVLSSVLKIDTTNVTGATLKKVTGSVIATNGTKTAVLDSFTFDATGAPVIGGVVQADLTSPTGFNVAPTEIQANYALFNDAAQSSANVAAYRFGFPFMIRWEYWEELAKAAKLDEFYSVGEELEGFNHFWYRLSQLAGFDVFVRVTVDAYVEDTGSLFSIDSDFLINVDDYESNSFFIDRSLEIYDGAMLLEQGGTPYIKAGAFSKLVATWQAGQSISASSFYVVFLIGPKEANTFKSVNTLSSIHDRSGVSYLEGVNGGGLVSVDQVAADKVSGTAYINPDEFLGESTKYSVYSIIGPNGLPLILNSYANGVLGYSVRWLNKDYSGACLRVRRDSDNAEQDIGFNGLNLDTASLMSFVGGASGFVTVWYDQAEVGGYDLFNTVASEQPKIVDSGTLLTLDNGQPTILFDGVDDYLWAELSDPNLPEQVEFSTFSVNELLTDNPNVSSIHQLRAEGNEAGQISLWKSPLNDYLTTRFVSSVHHPDASYFLNNEYITSQIRIVDNVTVTANGISDSRAGNNTITLDVCRSLEVGRSKDISNGNIRNANMNMSELIMFTADKTAEREDINNDINNYFNIY